MICGTGSIDNIPVSSNKRFVNWAGNIEFQVPKAFRPQTRAELVEIIHQAEEDEDRVKAIGSLWSFTHAITTTDVVIEMDDISGVINPSVVLSQLPLSDEASSLVNNNQLAHVRSGTKVCKLNRILHGMSDDGPCGGEDEQDLECFRDGSRISSRALATLGGSGGQAIGGLIATGSHGGDVELPPIADFIMAIHLIGPGGQEWWIERSGNSLTSGSESEVESSLQALARDESTSIGELCEFIKVKKDDDYFHAAMVSVGRMGVIYAFVVRTVEGFKLQEFRFQRPWRNLRTDLRPENLDAYLRSLTLVGELPHYFNVLINPYQNDADGFTTFVTYRLKPANSCNEHNVGMRGESNLGDTIQAMICRQANIGTIIPTFLLPLSAALAATIGAFLAIPFVGPFLAAGLIAAKGTLDGLIVFLTTRAHLTAGELIAEVAGVLYSIGAGDIVRQILSALFNAAYPLNPRTGVSWKIMDTYNYAGEDNCQKVDSMDFAFNVDDPDRENNYIAFINEVLGLFNEFHSRNVPVAGILALRYTAATSALIGMSQFDRTCHIEIPLLQGFEGNREMLTRIQDAAIRHRGIPHWGQLMNVYGGNDIQDLFGSKLRTWRRVLRELIEAGAGKTYTFSNPFTRRYNLEPDYLDTPEIRDCIVTLVERL